MKSRKFLLKCVLGCAVLSSLAGCGGGGGGDGDGDDFPNNDLNSGITGLTGNPVAFTVGTDSVIGVKFSFSANDVLTDDQLVVLSVRLPASVAFRPGSAEIQRPLDDNGVNPTITPCPDGTSLLQLGVNDDDLSLASNPSGDGDAELTFTVDGVSRDANAIVSARADVNAAQGGCANPFQSQGAVQLIIQ